MQQNRIYFGGDYNPEQWNHATWLEDMRLLKKAGVNMVTLPVFAWARLQPAEDRFDFGWLDDILDLLWENGIRVCMATPTAAQPAWMSKKYPDILPVDVEGRKRTHGKRVNICPNSESYRRLCRIIVEKMAVRYAYHPALALWHVSNEYGTYCYCEHCERKFRLWTQKRYGSIEEVNRRWNLDFWGHRIYAWDEIAVPNETNDDNKWYQPIYLDYLRFMTDSTIELLENEKTILRRYRPDIPVTTNISGLIHHLDQFEMCKHVDVVGWDNYPGPKDPPALVAFKHDLMRGLKGGQSYLVMEQSPNQQNWQPYNKLKRPGEIGLLAYQGLAHGADSSMYFQMRQSIAGVEKFHGALISHAGHEHTRVFEECARLGGELQKLGTSFVGTRLPARVALLFDWPNWWALELSSGPNRDLKYLDVVLRWYSAMFYNHIPVDVIGREAALDAYDVVLAPLLYMTEEGLPEKLGRFVERGGTFATGFFSGIVDGNDRVITGGYPGKLSDLLGIWVEEVDGLLPEESNAACFTEPFGTARGSYPCDQVCDLIHLRTAQALARYERDFYAGIPCVTHNHYGTGETYYFGSRFSQTCMNEVLRELCARRSIVGILPASDTIEVTLRSGDTGEFLFLLNHAERAERVELPFACEDILTGKREKTLQLAGMGYRILKRV